MSCLTLKKCSALQIKTTRFVTKFSVGTGDRTPLQQLNLPPVSPVFMSPSRKDGVGYLSSSMESFSTARFQGFPEEMSPIRRDVQRGKETTFSDSFVAGAYRDTRFGVADLRVKRMTRMKKQKEALGASQRRLEENIKRLEESRAETKSAKRAEIRRKKLAIWTNATIVIQRCVRGRITRRRQVKMGHFKRAHSHTHTPLLIYWLKINLNL